MVPAVPLWQHTLALQLACAFFVLAYVHVYRRIVRFRSPRWMVTSDRSIAYRTMSTSRHRRHPGLPGFFLRLFDVCRFDPACDRVAGWRSGQSRPAFAGYPAFVKSLGDAAITVLGNHDLCLLMVAEGVEKRRGKGRYPGRDSCCAETVRICSTGCVDSRSATSKGRIALVHAGLLPQWSVAQARALAAEVEQLLRGKHYLKALAHMWAASRRSGPMSLRVGIACASWSMR